MVVSGDIFELTELKEEIYIKPPPGYIFKNKSENAVLRLNRALYGLKQAAREWNLMLDEELASFGYERSPHDECLYVQILPMMTRSGDAVTGLD